MQLLLVLHGVPRPWGSHSTSPELTPCPQGSFYVPKGHLMFQVLNPCPRNYLTSPGLTLHPRDLLHAHRVFTP